MMTREAERKRLIETLSWIRYRAFPTDEKASEFIADSLLRDGVIAPPGRAGKEQLMDALYALSDMVLQFGYETTFRRQKAVCDGGLSALENAFWALEQCGCKANSNGTISVKNILEYQERIEAWKGDADK